MMARKFIVRSDRPQTVTGLGVFEKDEERTFTEADAEGFLAITGIPLAEDNLPEGCEVLEGDDEGQNPEGQNPEGSDSKDNKPTKRGGN